MDVNLLAEELANNSGNFLLGHSKFVETCYVVHLDSLNELHRHNSLAGVLLESCQTFKGIVQDWQRQRQRQGQRQRHRQRQKKRHIDTLQRTRLTS